MRKYIITSFVLIFIIFGIGSGVTIYHLLKTTTNLRHLINLHEIEDIRQSLAASLQKIQSYTFSSPDYFAKNVDEINDNADMVNQTVLRCYECHQGTAIEAELNEVRMLIEDYQAELSYLITTATEGEGRRKHQLMVFDRSNVILNQVDGMVSRAADSLRSQTTLAMSKIDESYMILAVTLALTFLAALVVAQYLANRITKPIDTLHTAATKIAEGEFGYHAGYKGSKEFNELIDTFNSMSASLAQKEDRIQSTLVKLNQLNHITLPLHSANNMDSIINNLSASIDDLIGVEHIGILLPMDGKDEFTLYFFDTGRDTMAREPITLTRAEVLASYQETGGKLVLDNKLQDGTWFFAEKLPGMKPERLLAVWMLIKDNVTGALIAINKKEGDFSEEDSGILGILANNMSVALDNIRLLKDAKQHMIELKNTQRQLIEAEKLTALGTLAGGVAHDFNNILCGMIGYVALLKRNRAPDEKDYKMLDTIEKAGFRAANLTKQLLTFSRQEAHDHQPIEINPHIENVTKLLENTISRLITIKLELADSLPQVLSDPAQLEQIIMNLAVNARDVMPDGGQILIRSELTYVDDEFCERHPEAKPGEFIRITVSDQGPGIDKDILSRIFEPFFTTKDLGKGTGLGLSMVYGIVKSHKGFIIVSTSQDEGTTFAIYLPAIKQIPKPGSAKEGAGQMMPTGILIVDDEELVASMLAEHLQNLGCQTYHASNGQEALAIVSRYKDELDVAILDINMPVMDGKAAYEKMMEIKPDLKVLVASGYTLNNSVEEMLAKGARGFVQKPYRLENITAKIKEIMQG